MALLTVTGGPTAPAGKTLAVGTRLTFVFWAPYHDGSVLHPRLHAAELDGTTGGWKPAGSADETPFTIPGAAPGEPSTPLVSITEVQVYTSGKQVTTWPPREIAESSPGVWYYPSVVPPLLAGNTIGSAGTEVGFAGARTWPYGSAVAPPPLAPPPPPSGTQLVTFTEDTSTDFLNPDRGWMHRGNNTIIANARAGDADHATGYSVVWTDVNAGSPFRLDAFQFSAISTARLNEIAATFQAAEDAGVRLKTRFTYSYSPPPSNPDATQARIEGHLDQLAPVLDTWQHVIASVDAGFVGRWGEWNASGNGITDWTTAGANARGQIIDAILAAVPTTRMVAHRNPIHVRERFGESGYAMSLDDRFTGTPQSRLGWLNDSYVANQSHGGTYDTWSGHPQPARYLLDRATFWHIGQYAVGTGETSDLGGLNEWNSSAAAIEEMAGSGIDTLFRKFFLDIINRWISEGSYSEISRRLGYRLVMREAELPTQVTIGGAASMRVQVSNVGFGKVYNPRAVDVVFVGAGGPFTARATADARRALPLGGETKDVELEFTVPAGMTPTADYDVHLRWPDPSPLIEEDNRYAIRFANTGVWDGATGRHALGASVTAVAP